MATIGAGRDPTYLPRLRLCRFRARSFLCLCFRIFLRRFLMTLPTVRTFRVTWRGMVSVDRPLSTAGPAHSGGLSVTDRDLHRELHMARQREVRPDPTAMQLHDRAYQIQTQPNTPVLPREGAVPLDKTSEDP